MSKRVHHISNLTTALSALRRRGLDLVNNNPTDIANGNPPIVLGLIWQIILYFQVCRFFLTVHTDYCTFSLEFTLRFRTEQDLAKMFLIMTKPKFQIESNIQLLREWGFELESPGPSMSRSGFEATPSGVEQQARIGQLKPQIEKVFLRWINAQLTRYPVRLICKSPLVAFWLFAFFKYEEVLRRILVLTL